MKMYFKIVKNENSGTYRIEESGNEEDYPKILYRSPFNSIEEARNREIEICKYYNWDYEEIRDKYKTREEMKMNIIHTLAEFDLSREQYVRIIEILNE